MQYIIKRILKAAVGFLIYAFGLYLMIQAGIGLAPWDVYEMGMSKLFGITYGQMLIIDGLIFLIIVLLIKERIGIGTIMDVLLVGTFVDMYTGLELIGVQTNIWISVIMLIAGMFAAGLGMYVYMSVGLCCGPRDSFMVGVGKRLRRMKIGTVRIIIEAIVLSIGYLLGGPVGIGTLISVVGMGWSMQIVFKIMNFEPRDVKNHDIVYFYKKLKSRG